MAARKPLPHGGSVDAAPPARLLAP